MTSPSDQPIQATLTLAEGTDVLAYVSQCELCGQRAITLAPHGSDWVCPRCAVVAETAEPAEPQLLVTEFSDEGGHVSMTARTWLPGDPTPDVDPQYVYTAPGSFTLPDDDEDDGPDLRKVRI